MQRDFQTHRRSLASLGSSRWLRDLFLPLPFLSLKRAMRNERKGKKETKKLKLKKTKKTKKKIK